MGAKFTSYHLLLSPEMKRELRHLCVEIGTTMNAVIVTALRRHLDECAKVTGPASPEQTP